MTALAHEVATPEVGKLVEVRGHRWVVADVDAATSTLVELQGVEDGRYGESLSVVWEVEPGRRVLPAGSLPEVDGHFTEREVHDLLTQLAQLRATRLGSNRRGRKAADLVTLLLKKQLFSSPEAFGRTVGVYRETLASVRRGGKGNQGTPGSLAGNASFGVIEDGSWLDDFFDATADLDDETLAAEEETVLGRAGKIETSDDTALDLARQQPLRPVRDPASAQVRDWVGGAACGPLFEVRPLAGAWARATARLAHPDHSDRIRPFTFDQAVAAEPDRGDDVMLAHLNRPLVAMSTRLLQAAVSSAGTEETRQPGWPVLTREVTRFRSVVRGR